MGEPADAPVYPIHEVAGQHETITLPATWPLDPLREECEARGYKILSIRVKGGLCIVRAMRPKDDPS